MFRCRDGQDNLLPVSAPHEKKPTIQAFILGAITYLFISYDGNLVFLLVKFNKQVKRILILEKYVTVRQKSTIRFFKARCTRKICFVCICTTLNENTLPHKHILIVTSHRSQTLSEKSISKFVDLKKEKDCNSPLRNNDEKDT